VLLFTITCNVLKILLLIHLRTSFLQIMTAVELKPVLTSLAVFLFFITQCFITLIMKKFIFFLAELFTVKMLKKPDVLKINTDTFSLFSHKHVNDTENNLLFTLHKDNFSVLNHFIWSHQQTSRSLTSRISFTLTVSKLSATLLTSQTVSRKPLGEEKLLQFEDRD
jgi:hypothetical protein